MENNTKKNKRTLLSSMEEIVNLAKKYSLEQEFYERASASIKYASKILSLTKDEAMLLAFFLEHSSSNRIWISNIADMIKVSNIRIISMMNVADELIKKGYLVGRDNGKEEKYYVVPIGVVNSIRQNHPVTPVKMTDLTVDEFFDHLGEIFEEEDVNQWDRLDKVQDLVGGNMHLQFCKAIESYGVYGMEYFLFHVISKLYFPLYSNML